MRHRIVVTTPPGNGLRLVVAFDPSLQTLPVADRLREIERALEDAQTFVKKVGCTDPNDGNTQLVHLG